MEKAVSTNTEGSIRILRIDNPPVNALGWAVRSGLVEELKAAQEDDAIKAIIICCAGKTFVAGADISEFGKPPRSPKGPEVIERIENSTKPIIAAMHGTVLGGGLELALSCHYRVAISNTLFGLPEVTLGIIPGGRGTIMLPRVVGVKRAAQMITSGTRIDAKTALKDGLINALINDNLETEAIAFAQTVVANGEGLPRLRDTAVPGDSRENADAIAAARSKLNTSKRNQVAPLKALDAIEGAFTLPFEEAAALERKIFEGLVGSAQASAMRHIFFAERKTSKIDGLSRSIKPAHISKAAVIGAGTMGSGIAMSLADAGVETMIYDLSEDALEAGVNRARTNYERSAKKGRISESDVEQRMALINSTSNIEDIADSDIVIEAIVEVMDVKKSIFKQLDNICKKETILASNTSNLDINEIGAVTSRPNAVLGAHFFSPANIMRLLEVVRSNATDEQTLATVLHLAKRMNKLPVVVGVCHGFVGNRMLHKYRAESFYLVEEGCLPYEVDDALYDWGLAMGPYAMSDLAGLDIGWAMRKATPRIEGHRYSDIPDKLCEIGRFGQKTGGGFYDYDPKTRAKSRNTEIEKLTIDTSKELGIIRREISAEEIIERHIFALVNEGAKILEEGIAQRASDIDAIYINGYGFPAYQGGPMHHANEIGLDTVYKRICEFDTQARKHLDSDPRWTPAPLLKKLAESGGVFE